jgi:hypothetical protein
MHTWFITSPPPHPPHKIFGEDELVVLTGLYDGVVPPRGVLDVDMFLQLLTNLGVSEDAAYVGALPVFDHHAPTPAPPV